MTMELALAHLRAESLVDSVGAAWLYRSVTDDGDASEI